MTFQLLKGGYRAVNSATRRTALVGSVSSGTRCTRRPMSSLTNVNYRRQVTFAGSSTNVGSQSQSGGDDAARMLPLQRRRDRSTNVDISVDKWAAA